MLLAQALLAPLLLGSVLVVGPDGGYRSIPDAVAAARDGDTVEVHGGIHPGPLLIQRPIALVGVGGAVLDGNGRGTVVTLAAPDVTLRGFTVRSSGSNLNDMDAGIQVQASGAVVEDNRLEDVLYGISLDRAPHSIVRGNRVGGKAIGPADRGDPLRLWYSAGSVVEDNQVADGRDCVIWYSEDVRVRNNRIEAGRYGLHFMYTDGVEVTGNLVRGNSVGVYVMYSRRVTLRNNLLAADRGPSGYGLGLKDVDNLVAENNWLVDNRVGLWTDGSPRATDAESRFSGNVFAANDIALAFQPSTQRNRFSDNAFLGNLQQVSLLGSGALRENSWSVGGRGNFWDDYRGLDVDGDGIGDSPYRAENLLGGLMDRYPQARFFQFGLASGAIEFAARAFPALRPAPTLQDNAPLAAPPALASPPGADSADPRPMLGVALALLGLASGALGLGRLRFNSHRPGRAVVARDTVLEVEELRKSFGAVVAVDGLSLTIRRGEAVALWGANGAGKTTAIKCILGLLPCSGRVLVNGQDALRRGPRARRGLGYVPQEVAFYDDLTVAETGRLLARLRGAALAEATELLVRLGLGEHMHKPAGVLSGGLRQRMALAMALLGDPPLLVLDEPMSNLDAGAREQVLDLLDTLRRQGTAIVFASHRLEEVEALGDRVVVLERGRAAFECPPRDLARRLGLRLHLTLRVELADHESAMEVLRAAGFAATPNGTARSIGVEVLPAAKAVPIRLLERAGIAVADFHIEDRSGDRGGEARP